MKSSEKDFPRISKTLLTKDNKTHIYWSVLQPSTPFHTLVKLVFAEDIANDKIRTHDLALEVNNITQQLQTQTLDSSQQVELLFTQPRDPNNKNKPAYKKFCSYCQRTNHSISACFKKQRDDEDNRDAYARSISPQKSFVQYFRSPSNDRTQRYDTRYRSRSTPGNNYYNEKKTIRKTYIVLHLEIDLVMTRVLLLHKTLDHDMTTIKEIRDPIALITDLLTDPLIDVTTVTDIDPIVFKR